MNYKFRKLFRIVIFVQIFAGCGVSVVAQEWFHVDPSIDAAVENTMRGTSGETIESQVERVVTEALEQDLPEGVHIC